MHSPEYVDDGPDLSEDENWYAFQGVLRDPFDLLDTQAFLTFQGVGSIRFRGCDGFQLYPAVVTDDCLESEVDVGDSNANLRLYSSEMAQGS